MIYLMGIMSLITTSYPYLDCWIKRDPAKHHEEEYLEELFKRKLPFFREQGQQDKTDPIDKRNASERWKEIRLAFPDARLPESVQEFIQRQSSKKQGKVSSSTKNSESQDNEKGGPNGSGSKLN